MGEILEQPEEPRRDPRTMDATKELLPYHELRRRMLSGEGLVPESPEQKEARLRKERTRIVVGAASSFLCAVVGFFLFSIYKGLADNLIQWIRHVIK
jgi:hypothetical protein